MCQKFFHCIFILANFMLRKTNYNFQPQLLTESVRRLWHFIVFASFGVDVVYLMLTMTGDMREGLVLRSLLCTSVVVFALSSVLPFLLCLPVFGIFLCVSVSLFPSVLEPDTCISYFKKLSFVFISCLCLLPSIYPHSK